MLAELHVSNLGVIEDVTVVLDAGMTALTGETGAGKTLLVDAISLLRGGPADASLVRPGAAEAVVEGRFRTLDGGERILTRIVPERGRSRAYVDGRMASAAQLAEIAEQLVDLHGQHGQQALLAPSAQRALLDQFGGISTEPVVNARRRLRELESNRAALGGDSRTRAREIDLLKFQIDELDAAKLESPDEDERLRDEEETLAAVSSLREAAERVHEELTTDGGVGERLGRLAQIAGSGKALSSIHDRLSAVGVEIADLADEARLAAESFEDDPERLSWIGSRRQVLSELRRKYGETLGDVIEYREEARARVAELESHDQRAAALDVQIDEARADLVERERQLLLLRRAAAPSLSEAVEARLQDLAMAKARFVVEVDDRPPGETVVWKLGANPGEPVLALTKVASGGELARTMLAARLTLGSAAAAAEAGEAPTLVFDEVDAGVGGEAAIAVGRALAALAADYQVLVVTHLPQVAAFADNHLVVTKRTEADRTVASVAAVEDDDRVVELSRMLSGSPHSETARRHAEELLLNQSGNPASPRRRARLR